ncbi:MULTISPECIES: hypothetical protein [unclassified Gilliamella]|uniref:hypothetical protein n=1 Tax=unclassified Gilliamella TaxID=2685620 RepID=UPI00080E5555|nr:MULTISPECIES: hypothetical protein [Gilliamella]MCX8597750.1 hypothetical protein [Gilliamella sp. B3493]MCX8599897.1 hypothetical protein [Gilliamella sp. B3486]MCX8690185.1 hypothetical protein [Gilliamella sp. B2973]MCX8705886.1 hypothetical protein [Gilliamella sp. B3127]OCF99821.1 hypothetical protein A9G08_07070 [Gilliamella apicola]
MNKIIILLVITFISIVTLTSCNSERPLEKALKDIEENHPQTITLSDYTNFKWDEAWLIYGNISGRYITLMREQNINVKKVEFSDKNPDFGKYQEHSDAVVYVYNKKVVYYEFPPDNRDREFSPLGFVEPFPLLEFNLERGQIIVVSSNNSEFEVKGKTLIPIKPIKIYENMDKKLK